MAPGLFAVLIMMSSRGFGQGRLNDQAAALAVAFAVGITYILAFGWPPSLTGDARSKILLSVVIGFAVGVLVHRRARWSKHALVAIAICIPVWLGLPSMQLGKLDSALLLLPIAAALSTLPADAGGRPSNRTSKALILLALAFGLAMLSALANAFSFAQLSLALASALVAILIIGREPIVAPASIMAMAMLLALMTALLLYTEASLPAVLVLISVLGAERLAHIWSGSPQAPMPGWLVPLFCILPVAASILIARIDAGPISIY